MDAVDRTALAAARGRVLDVGAGAGAHALPLLARGLSVTALDLLPAAVRVLRARGVHDAHLASVWSYEAPAPYDTILALMNGTGLAGTVGRLPALLDRFATLLAPGGQLLLDSTDLAHEDEDDGPDGGEGQGDGPEAQWGEGPPPSEGEHPPEWGEDAPGWEVHFQVEFDGVRAPPFAHLFLAESDLARLAGAAGWSVEVLARAEGRYLTRLLRLPGPGAPP